MPHLDPNTFSFIADLGQNNSREWFEDNRARYDTARNDFISFIGVLLMEIETFDSRVAGMDPRRCIFRIYRDTRFSNLKTPFKTNFGARILLGGSKNLHQRTGYFMNIEPGNCRLSGGAFRPEPEWLHTIRQRIATDSTNLKRILDDRTFRKTFNGLEGEAVKTAPRGFSKDHPDIVLIRQKSLMARHPLDDGAMFTPGFLKHAARVYEALLPLNEYLDNAH
ncbi:MAG: TIGR02453 family protein [Alphaproteobacteria bacterium]|nr:TIGR02453 family protein [Alphaproteobacteria bacterium]